MTFTEIYTSMILLWPEKISIKDGEVYPDGGYFSELAEIHTRVEETVGTSDPWRSLMVWTLFQIFHQESRALFLEQKFELLTREVSPASIEQRYYENLSSNEWKDLLPLYKRE